MAIKERDAPLAHPHGLDQSQSHLGVQGDDAFTAERLVVHWAKLRRVSQAGNRLRVWRRDFYSAITRPPR